MSGPKIDYAELERQRQAELERQRKERLRQIKMATDELNAQFSVARKNQATVESDSMHLISSLSDRSEMQDVLFKISEIKKEHQIKISALLNESVPTEADDIRAMTKRIAEKTANIYEVYLTTVKPYINRLKSFVNSENEATSVRSFVVSTKTPTISSIETFDFCAAKEQIDEVLREFGYSTSEEIILNRTQKDPHLISKKKDGNTGIHIHLSDRGEIMMEVVGVGETQRTKSGIENSVRVPSAELSDEQKSQLLSEQQAFCSMHPKIVEKLRERGIILNTRMHKEPSLQYALMILNMVGEEETLIDSSNIINIQEGDEHRIVRHKQEERALKR